MSRKLLDVSEYEAQFAAEYLVDLCGTQALLRIRPDITKASAAVQASRLLRRARVMAHIRNLQSERAERAKIRADEVLIRIWRIATADPRELITIKVSPCDDCYPPAESSGTNVPNPNCMACYGEGKPHLTIADTRRLSPEAAALYAGARRTRWGIEVVLHDRLKALYMVGEHLGMWGSGRTSPGAINDLRNPLEALLDELRDMHPRAEHEEPVVPVQDQVWRAVPNSIAAKKVKRS